MSVSSLVRLALASSLSLLVACGGPVESDPGDAGQDAARDAGDPGADAGADGGPSDAAAPDATSDAAIASDAGSCLDEHAAGDRFPAGDGCNFCDCLADGTIACTERACAGESGSGCEYAGVTHGYAERFAATDGCNECVCAASGLACTRRSCTGALEEGAILLANLQQPCGPDESFTAQRVLDTMPYDELTAPFLYQRDRAFYPETLPDTTVTLRIAYDGGFAVCRIPSPGQEAIDLEVAIEWITADGAFDEGFHAYLRRNAGGFVDAWWIATSAPLSAIHGTYRPVCLDPGGLAFSAELNADGTASGHVMKTCETDIGLDVGVFTHP